MQISELARAAGVKVSTVRFYERRGLIADTTRRANGYREYADADLRRVRFLRRGQELGFTLAELAELERMSADARGGTLTASTVAEHGRAKLAELDERIAELTRVRAAVSGLLEAQCLDAEADCPIVAAIAD